MRNIQILAVAFLGAIGCASEPNPRPPIDELNAGINMLDVSDPTWGATAAYVKGDHVVYMELRVGALKPEAYRAEAPDEPTNEMDFRFVDEMGGTFYVQRGGDEYIEPTWAAEINTSLANPRSAADRDRDFLIAREAAAAFSAVAPKGFEAFRFSADKFAERLPPSQDPEMIARAANIEASRPTDSEYATWGAGGSWWLEGDLYDKKTGCYLWTCWGRHSSVAMFAYSTSWSLVITGCNHGSCAGWSGMTYRCYSTSGRWVSNPTLSGEGNTGTSVGNGCLTPYDWDSGGYDHLCNDDSAYELWQVKNGNSGGWTYNTAGNGWTFVYTGSGTGGDGSWVHYACNCQNNSSCNNDWSRPICP